MNIIPIGHRVRRVAHPRLTEEAKTITIRRLNRRIEEVMVLRNLR